MSSNFAGFSDESFKFFRELRENNHKAWFDPNRSRYESHVTGAFRSLLYDLEPAVLKLNTHFEVGGKTNGNFSRINRDIRFSKDKSPYKSNYYLYFYDSRRSRDVDGRLYVGLSAECVTVGFAIYASWKKGVAGTLETVFRPRFEKERAQFLRLAAAVKRKRYESYWYRMDKKEWVLHPGMPKRDEDWRSMQGWIVRKVFEPGTRGVDSPSFATKIAEIFEELYPIYSFASGSSLKTKAAGRT